MGGGICDVTVTTWVFMTGVLSLTQTTYHQAQVSTVHTDGSERVDWGHRMQPK